VPIPNIPFFGSIWQAILSGIKPCAGLGKAQEKTATAPMTKKEQKTQDKALKKAKKNAAKEEHKFKKQQKKVAKKQARSLAGGYCLVNHFLCDSQCDNYTHDQLFG
jgi:hypothetical protein